MTAPVAGGAGEGAVLRVAVLQMTGDTDPAANAAVLRDAIERAATLGAAVLFTPEMTNLLDRDRARAATRIVDQAADPVVGVACAAARDHGVAVALGSVAVLGDGGWRNRSLFIRADGGIGAAYDKIHLFRASLGGGDDWDEGRAYGAGDRAVVVDGGGASIGLTICYDLRFPALAAALADAGAQVLAVPAAFTRPTGEAHWEVLLRARAIETGCFVVAAAQTGRHADGRATWGHSLAVSPWGEVLLDMGEEPGVAAVDLRLDQVEEARARTNPLANRRPFHPPELSRPGARATDRTACARSSAG